MLACVPALRRAATVLSTIGCLVTTAAVTATAADARTLGQ